MGDLEYDLIYKEFRGHLYPGKLKISANEIWFKTEKSGRVDHYNANDIEKAEWLIRSRGFCLKITQKSGHSHRYDGFNEPDFEKISALLKKGSQVSLEKREKSCKGWNWGKAKVKGDTMNFELDEKMVFDLPLRNVSNSAVNKNELILEFHNNDDAEICMTEMRFFFNGGDAERQAEFFNNEVQSAAEIVEVSGESVVEFKEVSCLQPRGRYDMKLYPTFIHFHGKTFDYKVPMGSVLRMFVLPHRDGRQMFFVLNLDPPLKHGQTRYQFVILLFDKGTTTDVSLNLTDKELQEKYEGKLQKEMHGAEHEVVSRLLKALVGQKITIPGSFTSKNGTNAIPCSYKTSLGFLYPLERGFMFVHKPVLHIRFDEVSFVQFARAQGSHKSFDFEVESKGVTHTFTNIEKDEYNRLYDFVVSKNIRLKNIESKTNTRYREEDWSSEGDHDDDVHDAYMEKVKKEGRRAKDAGKTEEDDDDDDDEDEDFKPGEVDDEDVAEEFDSNAESSEVDEDDKSGEEAKPAKIAKSELKPSKKKKAKVDEFKESNSTSAKVKSKEYIENDDESSSSVSSDEEE